MKEFSCGEDEASLRSCGGTDPAKDRLLSKTHLFAHLNWLIFQLGKRCKELLGKLYSEHLGNAGNWHWLFFLFVTSSINHLLLSVIVLTLYETPAGDTLWGSHWGLGGTTHINLSYKALEATCPIWHEWENSRECYFSNWEQGHWSGILESGKLFRALLNYCPKWPTGHLQSCSLQVRHTSQ